MHAPTYVGRWANVQQHKLRGCRLRGPCCRVGQLSENHLLLKVSERYALAALRYNHSQLQGTMEGEFMELTDMTAHDYSHQFA